MTQVLRKELIHNLPAVPASNEEPAFEVERLGGTQLGNCYWKYESLLRIDNQYRIPELIAALRSCGHLTSGQYQTHHFDGCGLWITPIGKQITYYQYRIETRVDSSD